jgi:parvulin-like peptidyl-prolyl isomerase
MKSKVILISAVCFLAGLLTGCENINFLKPKKAPVVKQAARTLVGGTIIAKVNNVPITLEELNQEIEAYNAAIPADKPEAKISTRDQKVNYLKSELVRRSLLYQEALTRGMDKKEDIVQALEKTKQDLAAMELVRQEIGKVEATSAEIEEYYNTYKEQLREPEERQIREIVVSSEQEARDILIQLLQGADFPTLAKDRSKAPSAKEGGDVGFIKKDQKFAQLDTAAFSDTLEAGKTSNIFKGPDGYYIIKLEGKRGGKAKSLSELWDDIKRGLTFVKQQQKIEELINKLSREAKIDVYDVEIK